MNYLQKSRVTVDFFMHERDVLQTLCDEDVRPPAEQLRWLVLSEAKRRGLQSASAKCESASTQQPNGVPIEDSANSLSAKRKENSNG